MSTRVYFGENRLELVNIAAPSTREQLRDQIWSNFGRYYGYPTCCIAAFVQLKHREYEERHELTLEGWGFVPCKKCMTKSRVQLILEINAARQHPVPFPTLRDEP